MPRPTPRTRRAGSCSREQSFAARSSPRSIAGRSPSSTARRAPPPLRAAGTLPLAYWCSHRRRGPSAKTGPLPCRPTGQRRDRQERRGCTRLVPLYRALARRARRKPWKFQKPSAGLEPATPSLSASWRGRSGGGRSPQSHGLEPNDCVRRERAFSALSRRLVCPWCVRAWWGGGARRSAPVPHPAYQRSGRCPSMDESVRTGRSPSRSDRLDGCRARSYPRSARCSSTSRAELSPTSRAPGVGRRARRAKRAARSRPAAEGRLEFVEKLLTGAPASTRPAMSWRGACLRVSVT